MNKFLQVFITLVLLCSAIACHEEVNLPDTLIPKTCRLALVKGSGIQISYTYDTFGNLLTETTPTTSIKYSYDAERYLTRTEEVTGGTTVTYDYVYTDGLVSEVTKKINNTLSWTEKYAYQNGTLSGITRTDGTLYVLENGRVKTETLSNGTINQFTYDGAGRLQSKDSKLKTNERTVVEYVYEEKFSTQAAQLLFKGKTGVDARFGKNDNPAKSITTKFYAAGAAMPNSTTTVQYLYYFTTGLYFQNDKRFPSFRSGTDGTGVSYSYTNCDNEP